MATLQEETEQAGSSAITEDGDSALAKAVSEWGHPVDCFECTDSAPSTSAVLSEPVEGNLSVADMVRETVNDFLRETYLPGFVFNHEYQLYYNAETGYYYDQNLSLFYHPSSRCYYYYDEKSGSYVFHSRVPSEQSWSDSRTKKRATALFGVSYSAGMCQDEVDVFECINNIVTNVCDESEEEGEISDESVVELSDDEIQQMIEDERIEYPPCIRLIDASNANALHIITITGATIGTAEHCDITISTAIPNSSENSDAQEIVRVEFDENEKKYLVTPLNSKIIVRVNDAALLYGEKSFVEHRDRWSIGTQLFVAHIHHGFNTCSGCEPGLRSGVNAASKPFTDYRPTISAEAARRRNLRIMKAQYGLFDEDSAKVERDSPYSDRALSRRKRLTKPGLNSSSAMNESSSIYAHCQAKPIPGATTETVDLKSKAEPLPAKPVDESNIGYKLLRGMGWKEGSGLGKDNTGIVQPVIGEVRASRAGLGSEEQKAAKLKVPSGKMRILEITKERYKQSEFS